jgi:hypothetical protein
MAINYCDDCGRATGGRLEKKKVPSQEMGLNLIAIEKSN